MASNKNVGRPGALVLALALLVVILPLGSPAWAAVVPTLDVEPEISFYNQGAPESGVPHDTVVLTATLSAAAPDSVNVDWENEGGANDPQNDGAGRTSPDFTCTIPTGANSCSISYQARETTGIANPNDPDAATDRRPDIIRAWIDLDEVSMPVTGQTDDSDQTEGRDENQQPGTQPPPDAADKHQCQNTGPTEPDCTDVVRVEVGGLEVAPDVQSLQLGSTATLIARLMAPVEDPDGWNIDFEHDCCGSGTGANDPDRSSSYTTPDMTCTIPFGATQCTASYVGSNGGSDRIRAWIDYDKTQSTTEADTSEGRYAGETDCDQPEDPPDCEEDDFLPADAASPGVGCNFDDNAVPPDPEDPAEPDCTDVVSVSFSAGGAALLDCDDRSGSDSERETKVSDPDPATGADPAESQEYRCVVSNQSGGGQNGVQVKAEVENGVNDLDSPDGASYESPEYSCTTRNDEEVILGAPAGVCYITVQQTENEQGTAEICFWVGTAAAGAALCADEPTGENQQANGTDTGNDLADQVELTWVDQSTLRLDCDPETDTNPAGQAHQVTCEVTAPDGSTVGGIIVEVEVTGAGDAQGDGNTPITPDNGCDTGPNGRCTFTHTSSSTGTTEYRAWINDEEDEPAPPPRGDTDVDDTEGRDETVTPGRTAEPDNTDVVMKTWSQPPTTVTMTPESDTARVGECNPYTITLTDNAGNPVPNAVIDVEQRHERAENQAANDEPTVGFCTPPESGGPNPSNVDETRGDLRAGEGGENPDNPGTAGGETEQTTDQNGRVTIGIRVAPGNGSNGTGGTVVRAWWETTDNDDPATTEPQDSSTKTWTPGSGEPGVPAGVNLEPTSASDEPGEQRVYTATVSDANGDPVEDASVTWSTDGVGEFASQETTTDSSGQAQATVTSEQEGTQTITVSTSECAEGASCEDSSTQVWEEQEPEACPGHENDSRNQVVGTSGDDVLRGTDGDDVICGFGGKDTLVGRGGNDLLKGGGHNDILRGSSGNDRLQGGNGEDTLQGGSGRDAMFAGIDDDILRGGGGNDRLRGGKGKDVLRGRGGNDNLKGGGGNDNLNGGRGRDTLNGGGGRDTCIPGDGRDRLRNCE